MSRDEKLIYVDWRNIENRKICKWPYKPYDETANEYIIDGYHIYRVDKILREFGLVKINKDRTINNISFWTTNNYYSQYSVFENFPIMNNRNMPRYKNVIPELLKNEDIKEFHRCEIINNELKIAFIGPDYFIPLRPLPIPHDAIDLPRELISIIDAFIGDPYVNNIIYCLRGIFNACGIIS